MKMQAAHSLILLFGVSLTYLGECQMHRLNSRGIPVPHFRFTEWKFSDEYIKDYAAPALGYEKDTWDNPSTSNIPVASSAFFSLSLDSRVTATRMGFTEDSWDCYVNHYIGKTWRELIDMDLDKYFYRLGWVAPDADDLDNVVGPSSTSVFDKKWNELNRVEREAAEELCYCSGIWDGLSLADWGYPIYRFVPFNRMSRALDTDKLNYAKELGYNYPEDWDNTGSNQVELKQFSALNNNEQQAAKNIGFTEASWDCYQNHYRGYTWLELEDKGVQSHFRALNWNQDSWQGNKEIPETVLRFWRDLSDTEQRALVELCYSPQMWNEQLPIPDWTCYSDHYFGSTWDELESHGVQQFFISLGWTQNSWHGNSNAPESQDTQWENLTPEEKYAASQVCFDESAWSARSAPMFSTWEPEPKAKGTHPFWVFTFVLLIVGGVTGIVIVLMLRNVEAKKAQNADVEFAENSGIEIS